MKFFIKQYTATKDRSLRNISGLIIGSAEDILFLFSSSLSHQIQRVYILLKIIYT